jgi:hypothetical protein
MIPADLSSAATVIPVKDISNKRLDGVPVIFGRFRRMKISVY